MSMKIVNRWPTRISPEQRRIHAEAFGESVRRRALSKKEWVIDLDEGTGENQTEVAVAVSDPDGLAVVWLGRTEGTAAYGYMANSALAGCAPALGFGPNVPDAKIRAWEFVKVEHAKHWSALEKLANQGG